MKINDVIKFLGLPAQSEAFDRYLTAHGISYRPVFKETPVDEINIEDGGISLVFRTADLYEELHGPLSEAGSMVFSHLQIYGKENDSGFKEYPFPLPYGLTFKSTLTEATKIFGQSTVDHPAGHNRCYVWYDYHGDTVSLCFLPNNQGVSLLELSKAAKEAPVPFDWD